MGALQDILRLLVGRRRHAGQAPLQDDLICTGCFSLPDGEVLCCGFNRVFTVSSRVCEVEVALDDMIWIDLHSFIATVISTVW